MHNKNQSNKLTQYMINLHAGGLKNNTGVLCLFEIFVVEIKCRSKNSEKNYIIIATNYCYFSHAFYDVAIYLKRPNMHDHARDI